MLMNPRWAISRQSFIGWLETQNPDQEYNWRDGDGRCLFGQYMQHLGIPWSWETYQDIGVKLFGRWDGTSYPNHGVAACAPWTFGAALARARAVEA